jgi:predicted GIY-YIG superfamily endonuclease
MKVAIYKITNKINNKAYIGITTKTTKTRFAEHIYSSENGGNYRINYAIRKYGKENFDIETIVTADNKEQALLIETENIIKYDSFDNGYNMNEGGSGLLYHTDDTKKKMSDNNHWKGKKRSGIDNPMFGREHSEESKKVMSEKKIGVFAGEKHPLFGKHHSEETKEKMRQKAVGRPSHRKGKKHSEESKRRMSEAKKGKVSYTKNWLVTFPDNHQEEIDNMADFCRKYTLNRGNMSSVASGKLNHYKKYKIIRI